jgi:hypothetical protein
MVRIAKTCLYVGFGGDGDDGTAGTPAVGEVTLD